MSEEHQPVDLSPLSERGKVKSAPVLVLGGALMALLVATLTFRSINEHRRGTATRGQISGVESARPPRPLPMAPASASASSRRLPAPP